MQWFSATTSHVRGWSWLKRFLTFCAVLAFLCSTFLYYTPMGTGIREFLAETVITTQHRDWAWIFVGAAQRDAMVQQMWNISDENAVEKQDMSAIKFNKNRKIDELVSVKDISGEFWKGKLMYVYDPRTIRVTVPDKPGEGERITSMVQRTGAVAAINGGGFVDPDGLGNGFAAIGPIISGGDLLYIDQDGNVPQHIVGFTKEGTLVIGKYTYPELQKLNVTEAVMFYPRVIANGKPLITSGDGGWGRGPRTAIGQRADGTVIFVVVDGRQAHSVGATLREIQDLLLQEGCVNAGFLDGGASSEMVYNNQLITSPSSKYGERRLPSAFLVFDHPDTLVNKPVWDGLTHIDPGGAYDNPYYQADIKAHPELLKKPEPAKESDVDTAKPSGKAETGTDKAAGDKATGDNKAAGTKPGETGAATSATGGSKATGIVSPAGGASGGVGATAGATTGGTTGSGTSGAGTAATGAQQQSGGGAVAGDTTGSNSGGAAGTSGGTSPGTVSGSGASAGSGSAAVKPSAAGSTGAGSTVQQPAAQTTGGTAQQPGAPAGSGAAASANSGSGAATGGSTSGTTSGTAGSTSTQR
jgi:exopolysaccharide biosynthesis protein